jgi:hypothetical protein
LVPAAASELVAEAVVELTEGGLLFNSGPLIDEAFNSVEVGAAATGSLGLAPGAGKNGLKV